MAVASEFMYAIINETYRPGRSERPSGQEGAASHAEFRRAVRSGLVEFLDIAPQESRLDIEAAGNGDRPGHRADVVVAEVELVHLGETGQVAEDLLHACRPGGRIGIACPVPGSLLAEVHARIEAYTALDGHVTNCSFTGTRKNLDRLFGARAIALGARDRSVRLDVSSAEHWLAEWRASYTPLKRAFEHIDPEWRGQFTDDLLRIAGSFAEVIEGKLSLHCDYLEFIVHKGTQQ